MKPALKIGTLISGAIATGPGATAGPAQAGEKTFQAVVTGTGTVSATIVIEVSNDPITQGWITSTGTPLGTITLTGTTTATDGFATQAAWAYYRANVTAISGTGAAVTVTVAQE